MKDYEEIGDPTWQDIKDREEKIALLREQLFDEYAKRGGPLGAINSEWVYSQGEWANAGQQMWVNERDRDDSSVVWEYGEFYGDASGEEASPRAAMRAAEARRAAHTPVALASYGAQALTSIEIEALRDILRDWNRLAQSKMEQMGFNAVYKNLHDVLLDAHDFTPEQADDLLRKLGIE